MKKVLISLLAVLTISATFQLSSTQVTQRVLKYIEESYIDSSRVDLDKMLRGSLNQVQKNIAEILVSFDGDSKFTVTVDQAVKKFDAGGMRSLSGLAKVLQDVYTFIEVHYHGTVEHQDIEYLAIDGLLSELDPHSNILTPKIFNEFRIGTKGKFGGIGIVIGNKDGELSIISPIEGTPAWRAGLKAGDKIVQIGEESTVNMTLTEAVERMRGDVGTDVQLAIERKGRVNPFSVTLKRAVINIESVQSQTLTEGKKNVGYIKIKNFQEDTDKEFSKQLAELKKKENFAGLILDLRNDPGGLLNQAVAIADKFISDGVIVSTVGAGGEVLEQDIAKLPGTEPKYPLIVLINEGSASASEIVAGALQSAKRATVIGSQSFGKGSVQTVYDLRDGSGLKLTIAEYLTGGKNSIQSVGVTPDVKLVPVSVDKDEPDLIENIYEKEESLEGHLAKSLKTQAKPKFSLKYFKPVEKNDEEKEAKEYSKVIDFSGDFAVNFAKTVIASSKVLEDVLKDAETAEQKKITKALDDLNLEWSGCSAQGKPVLQVSFFVQKGEKNLDKVKAGDEAELLLKAKNIGTGVFCSLVGEVVTDEHWLKNKEFLFGKIAPKSEREWRMKITPPKSTPSQVLPVEVKFHEANSNVPAEFKALLPIEGLPQPAFSYSFKLGEPEKVKVAKEGIPKGKAIPFIVDIKNKGGMAQDVIASIKNVDNKGLFIESGRVKLGAIEQGKTKQAVFKFRIGPDFSGTAFNIELFIFDQQLMASLSEKIEFNVANGVSKPLSGQWYQAPMISISGQKFPIVSSQVKFHIEGEITDDQAVKDYYVFVGDSKEAYFSNSQRSQNFKINAGLSLKEGNNLVTVVARDDQDMASRFNFVVERK